MQKPTPHLLILAASSALALTALSTTADNHTAPKATKKIIIEKIEGSCAQSASMLRPRLAGTVRVNLIALNSPAIIQYLI